MNELQKQVNDLYRVFGERKRARDTEIENFRIWVRTEINSLSAEVQELQHAVARLNP